MSIGVQLVDADRQAYRQRAIGHAAPRKLSGLLYVCHRRVVHTADYDAVSLAPFLASRQELAAQVRQRNALADVYKQITDGGGVALHSVGKLRPPIRVTITVDYLACPEVILQHALFDELHRLGRNAFAIDLVAACKSMSMPCG